MSPKPTKQPTPVATAIGLDIGTANIACSVVRPDGQIATETIRDCFLTMPIEEEMSLQVAGVKYFVSKSKEHALVLDQDAVKLAGVMGGELRRPLAKGFISDKEDLSKEVVQLILQALLGEPRSTNELVVYSIPGEPLDSEAPKAPYHTRFFFDRIKELHFTPQPINEALAVCYSETAKTLEASLPLTGLCFSFGAGMINVALVYQSIPVRTFSLSVGGDFIDEAAAKATNSPLAQVTLLKEEGLNLNKSELITRRRYHDAQTDRQVEALCLMYRELLTKLRDGITEFFARPKNRVEIKETLPVIVSGGTSMAVGFLEMFDEIVLGGIDVRFPLAEHAIQAADPMTAVSTGALRFARIRQNNAPLSSEEE